MSSQPRLCSRLPDLLVSFHFLFFCVSNQNFWIPLTDRDLTGVDLWGETEFQRGDYHPVKANPGEIISFHGSSCRHYVNANENPYTRVSMDFRVGVEGFFDPKWEMRGTTDDHSRREVRL